MMVEDKLKTTDWEATSDVVVEQIARQSYLQFCKENNDKKMKANKSATVTSTEACGSSSSISTSSCDAGQSCSSNCETEKNTVPYLEYAYVGRRSKKRHHHHHHM